MSQTAAQAQADLDSAVANLTTVLASAVALLNQLAAALLSGPALDPAKVEADVKAINDQVAALAAAVKTDTPPAA